jgi:hypothetical protein
MLVPLANPATRTAARARHPVHALPPSKEEPTVSSLTRFRPVAFGLLALAALLALPGGARSAPPTFHDKLDFTIEDIDICGVVGTLHITGTQVVTLGDTTVKVTGQVTQVFNAPDGRTAVIKSAGQFTSTFTDNGDGTITFVDTYKGLPEKISARGQGGTETRDAGIISFVTTIDINTGEVTTEVVVQRGPHPEADSDFTLFCDAFLAALG